MGAQSNNALGITGVSWESKIVPIKIYPGETVTGLSAGLMKKAIQYAAELDDKVKIINFSTGFEVATFSFFCEAHRLIQEKLGLPITDPECIEQADKIKKTEKGRDEVCAAVDFAIKSDKIFIAAAGNFYRSNKIYPAACAGAIAVAGVEPSLVFSEPERWFETPWVGESTPSGFIGTQYGDWVDIAAPASGILSTIPKTTCEKDQDFWGDIIDYIFGSCFITTDAYGFVTGTSQATPFVAGAAAVVLTKHPEYSSEEVEDRLKKSATPMPGEGLGAGALNIFDAVFNGNFEVFDEESDTKLAEWSLEEPGGDHCSASSDIQGIKPPAGDKMLICDNGGSDSGGKSLSQSGTFNTLDIPEGVTKLPLSFKWKLVTEEFTWLLSNGEAAWNDKMIVELVNLQTGIAETVLEKSVNDVRFEMSATLHENYRQSDWNTLSKTMNVQAGRYALQFRIEDTLEKHEEQCIRWGTTLNELLDYLNCLSDPYSYFYPNFYYYLPKDSDDDLGDSFLMIDQVAFRLFTD